MRIEHARIRLGRALFIIAAGLAAMPLAQAQPAAWPSKPVRLVVPYTPGGTTDILARMIGQKAGDALGQPVVADNRPGAATMIGTDIVAKSAPDGHTLLMAASTFATNGLLYRKIPYTIDDFDPVAIVARVPLVLAVTPSVPSGNLREFIAYVKANPTKVSCATFGKGTTPHLACEMFKTATDTSILDVPYKGATPALNDLLRGDVQVFFDVITTALPFHNDGRIRILGVMNDQRATSTPGLSTFAELGYPNVMGLVWFGILAPARTPPAIVNRLNGEIQKALAQPDLRERIEKMGSGLVTSTPEEFRRLITQDRDRWEKVIRPLNLSLD